MLKPKIEHFTTAVRRNSLGLYDYHPTPFPGVWPTRVAWRVRTLQHGTITYCGKPTRHRCEHFQRLIAQNTVLEAWIMEFDRTHRPIYLWDWLEGRSTHAVMFGVYHPWRSADNMAMHLTGTELHRLRPDGRVIYSPYRIPSADRKAQWRAWIAQYVQEATV